MTAPDLPDEVEPAVVDWLRRKLDDPDIEPKDNFLEVGGHSLLAIELSTWLRDGHSRTLDVAVLFNETIRDAVLSAAPTSAGGQDG